MEGQTSGIEKRDYTRENRHSKDKTDNNKNIENEKEKIL